MFKFEHEGRTVEIEEKYSFDPRKNKLLLMPKETLQDVLHFAKEVFRHNKEAIMARKFKETQGPIREKFLETFYRLVPEDDQHVLMAFSVVGGHSDIYFEFPATGDEYRFSNTHDDIRFQDFLRLITRAKASTHGAKYSNTYNNSASYFDAMVNAFAGNQKYSSGRSSSSMKEIIEYIDQGGDPTIVCEINDNQLTKLEITMPVTYETRSSLYKTFGYSERVPSVLGVTEFRDPKESIDTLYGIELEMSSNCTQREIIDAFPEIYAILKQDGSVSGNKANPYELVTLPRTMKRHKKNLAHFFKSVNIDQFDTRDSHTNGMHVHIDRTAFDPDTMHLKKFCWFFSNVANRSFLTEVSERRKPDIDMWCQFVDIPKSTKQVSSTKKTGGWNYAKADTHASSSGRKSAVNLSNTATVEVRLFKGVVSFASIIKNIEFCDAVLEFSRHRSFVDQNVDTFLRWLHSLPTSSYRTLRLCLENLNLEAVTFESKIAEVLQSGTPTIVLDILNKMYTSFSTEERKKVIGMFRSQFFSEGATITNDTNYNRFELNRAGTKFSQFNDKTLSMFNYVKK